MELNLLFWVVARVTGLTCFCLLGISLLTGMALRTGVLDLMASNRSLRSLHDFTAVLWIPLGLVHVVAIALDRTARVGFVDVVVPFHVSYGTFAIGLGTLSLDLVIVVALVGWFRRRLPARTWQLLHRLAYVAFALAFLHAVLGGSDFTDRLVSAVTWSLATVMLLLSMARAVWGRLPE